MRPLAAALWLCSVFLAANVWSRAVPSGNSELRQQLADLSVGQKLKLTVDTVDVSGATFKSDSIGATLLANSTHMTGG